MNAIALYMNVQVNAHSNNKVNHTLVWCLLLALETQILVMSVDHLTFQIYICMADLHKFLVKNLNDITIHYIIEAPQPV